MEKYGLRFVFLCLKVNKVLAALQVEVENFILRMAAEFPLRKEQLIFLINNYDMMLAVLMVSKLKRIRYGEICNVSIFSNVTILGPLSFYHYIFDVFRQSKLFFNIFF